MYSFTAKDTKDAEEEESFTAKEIIINARAKSEGREGTAPRVAYRNALGHIAVEIKSFSRGFVFRRIQIPPLAQFLGALRIGS
jgi:hypothetical protein